MAAHPPKTKDSANERLLNLKDAFQKKYGESPLFYARAPGRVNPIGEHIDYCGYAVILAAVTPPQYNNIVFSFTGISHCLQKSLR
uniref:Galactokinase N-terminal domain-containing protein n=1 Tax=Hucho hucho TaxID=62062 RepID=A0A4W5KUX8_9TELE